MSMAKMIMSRHVRIYIVVTIPNAFLISPADVSSAKSKPSAPTSTTGADSPRVTATVSPITFDGIRPNCPLSLNRLSLLPLHYFSYIIQPLRLSSIHPSPHPHRHLQTILRHQDTQNLPTTMLRLLITAHYVHEPLITDNASQESTSKNLDGSDFRRLSCGRLTFEKCECLTIYDAGWGRDLNELLFHVQGLGLFGFYFCIRLFASLCLFIHASAPHFMICQLRFDAYIYIPIVPINMRHHKWLRHLPSIGCRYK